MAEDEEDDTPTTTNNNTSALLLYDDVLARILSYLPWQDLVQACRRVSRPWRHAVSVSAVAVLDVHTPSLALQLDQVAQCLPKLQTLRFHHGTDLTDDALAVALRGLRSLRRLECWETTRLQRVLADALLRRPLSLPNLVQLNLHNNTQLEWNLADLVTALPQLRDLRCVNNRCATGCLSDLLAGEFLHRVTVLDISGCAAMTGNWMELRTACSLTWLGLARTAVGGDVRDLRKGDFPALQWTGLCNGIYGARQFDRVAHAAAILQARHILVQQSTRSVDGVAIYPFMLHLSEDSPDYHERIEQRLYRSAHDPPFSIEHVTAGPRRGWRWSNLLGGCCRVQWLDPEPTANDAVYQAELVQLQEESQDSIFLQFTDPPTPEQYTKLCREL